MAGVGRQQAHFLEACFLCQQPLVQNRDIYMYRGNVAFCSEECRSVEIEAAERAAGRARQAETARAGVKRPTTHGFSTGREVDGQQYSGKRVRAGSVLAL